MKIFFTSIIAASVLILTAVMASHAGATTVLTATPSPNCTSAVSGTVITGAPGDTIIIVPTGTACKYLDVQKSLVNGSSSITVSVSGGPLNLQDFPNTWAFNVSGTDYITRVEITIGSSPGTINSAINIRGTTPPLGGTQTTWRVTIGSGSGGGSSTAATPTPTFEIDLRPTDGTSCSRTSQSGTSGTWLTLPEATDCTPPGSKAGATLLGWSTSPDFPIAIAQRQVTNGWGAYETFNDDGQMTGVFIPAGGATLLSASGKLYTVWSE